VPKKGKTPEEIAAHLVSGVFRAIGIPIRAREIHEAFAKQQPPQAAKLPPRAEYAAPPPKAKPAPTIPWRVILGFSTINGPEYPTRKEIETRYRDLVRVYGIPDTGGSIETFRAVTAARDAALKEIE
jgi:hypothetical protein